jgi:hypothetical protein
MAQKCLIELLVSHESQEGQSEGHRVEELPLQGLMKTDLFVKQFGKMVL